MEAGTIQRANVIVRGHVELHVMAETGRTIRVLCDCSRGIDHVYAGRSET